MPIDLNAFRKALSDDELQMYQANALTAEQAMAIQRKRDLRRREDDARLAWERDWSERGHRHGQTDAIEHIRQLYRDGIFPLHTDGDLDNRAGRAYDEATADARPAPAVYQSAFIESFKATWEQERQRRVRVKIHQDVTNPFTLRQTKFKRIARGPEINT